MKLTPLIRVAATGAAIVLAAGGLAACSGGEPADNSPDDSNATSSEPLRVATLPVTSFLLPYLAQEEGLFEAEGITVELEVAPGGGQAQLPLVVSGDYDLGVAGAGDILSLSQGSDLYAIAGAGGVYEGDVDVAQSVIITKDPDIQAPADLEGKTIGLNSIGSQTEAAVRVLIDEDGGDSSTTTFVQVPVQNSLTAVSNSQVDAAVTNEPFLTQARLEGGYTIVASNDEPFDGLPSSTYFATKANAEARGDDISAFVRAMQAAAKMANEDPELVRQLVADNTETPADLLAEIEHFTEFAETTDVGTYEDFAQFMVDAGLIPSLPAQEDWLFVPTT